MCVIATATATATDTGGGVDIIAGGGAAIVAAAPIVVAGRVIHVLVPSAPGRVNVQYLSSVHHTGDALKLLLTAIHSHLQSKGKKGKGKAEDKSVACYIRGYFRFRAGIVVRPGLC